MKCRKFEFFFNLKKDQKKKDQKKKRPEKIESKKKMRFWMFCYYENRKKKLKGRQSDVYVRVTKRQSDRKEREGKRQKQKERERRRERNRNVFG